MRIALAAAAALALSGLATGQDHIINPSDGSQEGGWVVAIPAGSSDYFNTRTQGLGGVVNGMNIAVADFGASVSAYPTAGIYRSNLALDATGVTPDLASAITGGGPGAYTGGLPLFTHQTIPMAPAAAEADMHAVVQFPAGDPGLLGVGADSDAGILGGGECPPIGSNPHDASAFTTNGYSTAAASFAGTADFAMGPNIECGTNGAPLLLLSALDGSGNVAGDYDTLTTRAGEAFGLGVWGEVEGGIPNLWLLFISFLGTPILPVGSPLPTFDCGNGFSNIRISSAWPSGAGNLTINFVVVAGSPGVIGSIDVSNEVTLCSLPDPSTSFGVKDDGSFESGWVVAIPSGSSDYFSTPWGTAPGALSQSSYAVMDFGSTASSYPRSGQAPPNLGLDPAGNTPDLASPYVDTPLFFAPLTFTTTAGQMTVRTFGSYTPGTPVLEFIQFPVGDPGLLGLGADTNNTFIDGLAGWTLDGFSSPANLFGGGNWGMRTQ